LCHCAKGAFSEGQASPSGITRPRWATKHPIKTIMDLPRRFRMVYLEKKPFG